MASSGPSLSDLLQSNSRQPEAGSVHRSLDAAQGHRPAQEYAGAAMAQYAAITSPPTAMSSKLHNASPFSPMAGSTASAASSSVSGPPSHPPPRPLPASLPPPPAPPASGPASMESSRSSTTPTTSTHHGSPTAATPAQQRSHSNSASLYQCADCQRRYTRPEHLARHIQTHTLGKRFFCPVCGKAFARADLLKRHHANHDNDNDATKKRRRINAEPGAGRVSHACRACAAARVKCEEAKPCTRCRSRNLTCEYASTEAGSAAAMHLLHLSSNARSSTSAEASSSSPRPTPSQASSPPSPYHPRPRLHSHLQQPHQPQLQQPQKQQQQQSSRVSNSTAVISPALTQNPTPKQEEAQLPTPDTVMERGRCHVLLKSSPCCSFNLCGTSVLRLLPKFQLLLNAAGLWRLSHRDRDVTCLCYLCPGPHLTLPDLAVSGC